MATLTAVAREVGNCTSALPTFKRFPIPRPTVGAVSLVLANAVLLIVLCFYKVRSSALWDNQNIAYRCGFLSLAQLPLIFLLSAKNNVIGLLTGMSYERLNWLHRWTARTLLITVTLHMAYWFADWAPFGGYIEQKITTDSTTKTGLAAWVILVWIVISSMTPIRGWSYEIFVAQHIISFFAFFITLYLHLPSSDYTWLWVCVGLFFFDRIVRGLFVLYTNCALFHPRQRKEGKFSGLWACKAVLTPLSGNMTRITIHDPPMKWRPGQHVFITSHTIAPLQSHPFTIASIPQDGKLEFLVKAHRGGTKRFLNYAQKYHGLPLVEDAVPKYVTVSLDGPYGQIRPLKQFDSVVLFAGSTGATFTMPLLRDIVRLWRLETKSEENGLGLPTLSVTRHVRFVWAIKSREQLTWFAAQLFEVMEAVESLRKCGLDVTVEASIYVTCDESFTADWQNSSLLEKQPLNPAGAVIVRDEMLSRSSSEVDVVVKEKQGVEIQEVDSRSSNASSSKSGACQPDGTCCCQTTVEDESEDAVEVVCHCNCSHNPASSLLSVDVSKTDATPSQPLLHPSIALLSGRPHPRNIIRKSLEGAKGESAVVVCGPRGLIYDARQSVVALSDERAVHKGTGAQGVWFWSEGFGW